MTGFFEEVKRRKVYRVAAAYIIAAGGIIQLASATFPAWELPNWSLRLVILLLLVGFPIALILAWAFDITSQGIQATPETTAPRTRRRRNIIMLIATGVVISAATGFFLLPRVAAHKVDKSIAVLPFENLSDEKENAYFADGVQDDVLTNLSKISDLRVISRTSVMQYRGRPTNPVKSARHSAFLIFLREASADGKPGARQCSINRCQHRRARLGQRLRPRCDRRLCNPERSRARNYQRAASEAISRREIANDRKPTENGEAYLAFVQAPDLSCATEDQAN